MDYLYWFDQNVEALGRLDKLIERARRMPFDGIGKPEPLEGAFKGVSSRCITREHRAVYAVEGKPGVDQRLVIAMCRHH